MMQEFDDDFFFEEDKMIVATTGDNDVDEASREKLESEENLHDPYEFQLSTCEQLHVERYNINYQDLMGMMVTSGSVALTKDEKNLIGISIGGGAPLCPCLYIVQVFDNSPAAKEGSLQSGDELIGVNGQTVKGKTKVEVAKMIQSAKEQVTINYNKLHADPKQGKSLDIIMKKLKHRLVDNMSSGAADALGLSRAILCNDTLVAKLKELSDTDHMYRKMLQHSKSMLKSYFDLLQTYKHMGDAFAAVGVRESQARASEAFTKFGNYHRQLERDGIHMIKQLKPIMSDMSTYLNKAIPDTKLTIKKYLDTKFEYLSYCLKVKEMDDEEYSYNTLQEPLYRVETGNYEYRLILRCRQDARCRFAKLRSDVMVKLELLYSKRTNDVAVQLQRFITGLAAYHGKVGEHLAEHLTLFPVEVDLSQNAFQYKSTTPIMQDCQDEEYELGKEIEEHYDLTENHTSVQTNSLLPDLETNVVSDNLTLLSDLIGEKHDFGEYQSSSDLIEDLITNKDDGRSEFEKFFEEISLK